MQYLLEFKYKYKKQKLITSLVIFIIIIITVAFIFSLILFAWYSKDLPSPSKLSKISQASTIFYDRNGKIIYDMFQDKNRIPVKLNDLPDYLKKATIAIEDKNFYKHQGFSQSGIIRAFFNILIGKGIQGGSTITQQLIKNTLLSSKRTLSRKIQEIILAYQVEKRYSKDEILLMYLNESPYGGTYWGVGTAARAYFNKEVKDLNLIETAILAGLPQSPSVYSPFIGKKDAWKKRTTDVLRRMREDGYITKIQEKQALKQLDKITFSKQNITFSAPHFVFYVKNKIEDEYSPKIIDQGIKIKTTLDLEIQKITEKIVKEEINKLKKYNVTNAAVVILDSKTGDILTMVGSYDYNNDEFGKFNAALGLRQPGSTVKPITYAIAFEKGYTPAMVLMDLKTEFTTGLSNDKPYIPVNYDGKYRGPMQIRFALGNSENIPAVKMLAIIGIKDFLQKAYSMGLIQFAPTEENLKRFGLSITLGGGETTLLDLTAAFSVFANGGIKKPINNILEIKDYQDKKIFQPKKYQEKKIFSKEIAFLISHILSDNNARLEVFGPHSYLNIPGKTVAVKTGTTDDKRDNWVIGYTKSITVGVWVGNNDNSPMNPAIASGTTGASPIFYRLMKEVLKKYEDGIVEKPNKVKAVIIDAFLGGLPKDGYPTRSEYFIEGSEPKDISPFYKKIKISKITGKIANEVEIKTGNFEEKEFIIIIENDPLSQDGVNRWQEAINKWVNEQTDQKFKPPKEISDASSNEVMVSIKNPMGNTTVNNNSFNINAKIISLLKIKNIKIKLNGNEIKSINEDKKEISEPITLSDGIYELQIIATNEKDKSGESTIKFGVNKPWDYQESSYTITPNFNFTPTL